jgi:diadenosine tetraphosphate (Ap4A) HIT family hydrolase
MLYDAELPTPPSRFAWILRGATSGPDEAFDEDLACYPEAAVIPTRGAFVPTWLLVVPRTPCLSLAEIDTEGRARFLNIANEVSKQVAERAGACVTFEHGPGRRGTAAGCGVDQAHLHVVGGAPDLLARLMERVSEAWLPVDHADPWSAAPPSSDYLMIRDQCRTVLAVVSNPTSQRLRRALADALGIGQEWDYRSHPNATNARRTKEMFRGAFAHAAS